MKAPVIIQVENGQIKDYGVFREVDLEDGKYPLYPEKTLFTTLVKSQGKLIAVTLVDEDYQVQQVLWERRQEDDTAEVQSLQRSLERQHQILRNKDEEIKELKTMRGNSVLVPSDKLKEMQVEIRALKEALSVLGVNADSVVGKALG